jgi:hypothetical protein
MQLAPGPTRLRATFLDHPFARAAQLHARAVHQQMQGFGITAGAWPRHLQCLGPAAQSRVVRHREIETEQADEGADQPLGLAQGQAEDGSDGQRRGDRQG